MDNAMEAQNAFDQFWLQYPSKVGKLAAQKHWHRMRPPLKDVLKALAWQSTQESWLKDEGQYIPNPATYLYQGRWMDEPKAIKFNGKPWHECASGIEAKAKEMGVAQMVNEPPYAFYARVKSLCQHEI